MDDLLRYLATVGGIVVTFLGGFKIWKEAKATSFDSKNSGMQAVAKEWREMKDDYRERLTSVEDEIEELRVDKARLVSWIARLHYGIQDGTIPPLPDVPDWLNEMLIYRIRDFMRNNDSKHPEGDQK